MLGTLRAHILMKKKGDMGHCVMNHSCCNWSMLEGWSCEMTMTIAYWKTHQKLLWSHIICDYCMVMERGPWWPYEPQNNVKLGSRDRDFVKAWNICNIYKQFEWIFGFLVSTMVPLWVLVRSRSRVFFCGEFSLPGDKKKGGWRIQQTDFREFFKN
jgi:hypothetical protein